MSLARYPKYRDSGVEWLGKVPAHWTISHLKRLISKIDQGVSPQCESEPAPDGEWGVLKVGCVNGNGFDAAEQKALPAEVRPVPEAEIRPGDILMSRGNTLELVGSAALVGAVRGRLLLSDLLYRFRAKDSVSPAFLTFALRSAATRLQIERDAVGTSASMKKVSQELAYSLLVATPTLEEQVAIAAFLDRETARIDALVAEQERLIELLREKRRAAISNAVTKGLNPGASMKDSGIEWLGEVPAHWELRRVKTVSSFTTSGPRGWSDRISDDGSLFIQSGDLNDSLGIDFNSAKRVLVHDDAEAARTRLAMGDVVVCITGAKTGKVAVCETVPEEAYVNQHLCLIRPSVEVLPAFLATILKGRPGQVHFELSQYGLKQGLSLEDVREAPVLVPPRLEQAEILAYLARETTKIDALADDASRGIDLLQERRTALISAAITGRIDVRGLTSEDAA